MLAGLAPYLVVVWGLVFILLVVATLAWLVCAELREHAQRHRRRDESRA